MLIKGDPVAADPDAYVRKLHGWKKDAVTDLRAAVTVAANLAKEAAALNGKMGNPQGDAIKK